MFEADPRPRETGPGRAAGSREETSSFAATVAEAVNAAERRICGNGAVRSIAVAEGLVAAGRRAATLITLNGHHEFHTPNGPVVVHRIAATRDVVQADDGFRLAALDAQQAVDHCLVAHTLAAWLGRAGLCGVDPQLGERLAVVRLPGADAIAALPGIDGGGGSGPRSTGDGETLDVARRAFEHVSRATGRELSPVSTHRVGDAEFVVVATGAAYRPACRAVERMREGGIAAGAVGVSLVSPLPLDEIERHVRGKRAIGLLEEHAGEFPALLHQLRSLPGVENRAVAPILLADDLAVQLCELFEVDAAEDSLAAPSPPRRLVLAAVPSGERASRLLCGVARTVAEFGASEFERVARAVTGVSGIAIGAPAEEDADDAFDVLCVAHPSLLRSADLDRLAAGGALLLFTAGAGPAEVRGWMSDAQTAAIRQRKLTVSVVRATALLEGGADRAAVERRVALAVLASCRGTLAKLLPAIEEASDALDAGSRALEAVDLSREPGARPPAAAPVMPASTDVPETAGEAWQRRVHRFYRTGEAETSPAEPLFAPPLKPFGLAALLDAAPSADAYPMVRPDASTPDGVPEPFVALLERAAAELQEAGQPLDLLAPHLARLARVAAEVAGEREGWAPFTEVVDETFARLSGEFDVSAAAAETLRAEIARLRARIPERSGLIGLNADTPLATYLGVMLSRRRERRRHRLEEIARLEQRLTEMLRVDDRHGPRTATPEALSAALGEGKKFLDADWLSQNLPKRQGSKPLDGRRRRRIERVRDALRECRESASDAVEALLVRPAGDTDAPEPPGCRVCRDEDTFGAALGLFEGLVEQAVGTARAARTARLELSNGYEPERHDVLLERLDWRSLSADELLLLPQIVVLETSRRVQDAGLAGLSQLLRAGRPIHVLIAQRTVELDPEQAWEELSGYHADLGYLAVAHREAFVLQATLGDPSHLAAGLRKMADAEAASVAIVEIPVGESPASPWLQLVADLHGRKTPCLEYDPQAGEAWADRFSLSGNPQVDAAWPTFASSYERAEGELGTLEVRFTFAHAAALDPAYRSHFLVVPAEAWTDDQIDVANWLELDDRRGKVPFLWVEDESGALARAVMTRELAFGCLDRRRAWRTVQELAGIDNAYVRDAEQRARAKAEEASAAALDELKRTHEQELQQARRQAVDDAMGRLAAALLELEPREAKGAPAAVSRIDEALRNEAAPAPTEETSAAAPVEPVAEEEHEEEEEDLVLGEAYIDSMLCTTCNECTNLNPRMFRYNADKQAEIVDLSAGTFEQLVVAAEKCPARCIHPGIPRDDDTTATPEMRARAEPFA